MTIVGFLSHTCNNLGRDLSIINYVSEGCSVIALFIWALGQLPQLAKLYTTESIAGISIYFLLFRFLGDTLYLVNSIIIDLSIGNRTIISYFCFIDTILLLQYWYYWDKSNIQASPLVITSIDGTVDVSDRNHGRTLEQDFGLDQDLEPGRDRPYEPQNRSMFSIWGIALLSLFSRANGFPIFDFSKNCTSSSWIEATEESPISSVIIWSSVLFFIAARIFQINENYKAKSMALSIYFVVLYLVGAMFYLASLITELWLLIIMIDDSSPIGPFEYVLDYLPYICGVIGTIIGDSIIVYQYSIYVQLDYSPEPVPAYHFKPDWYTPSIGNDDDTSDGSLHISFHTPKRKKMKRLQRSSKNSINYVDNRQSTRRYSNNGENSSRFPRHGESETDRLLKVSKSSYSTPPPSHYVSSAMVNTPDSANRANGLFEQLGRSFTNSYKNSTTYMSIASPKNATPISTSLLPSIIGTYSKVGRKMSNDSKIPFSPIDFLNNNDYSEDADNSSSTN